MFNPAPGTMPRRMGCAYPIVASHPNDEEATAIMNKSMDWASRVAFGTASLALMAMSLALVGFGVAEFFGAAAGPLE